MRFVSYVLGALLLGLVVGRLYHPDLGDLYELVLYVLIFVIGIDLGLNFRMEELRKLGRKSLVLPIGTLAGSLLGGD